MRALTHGRTNIIQRDPNKRPTDDKYCYWDESKQIVKRLNYTIKPNNTRDYGSRGAMENRIRTRVFNNKRSVPLFGMGNGGWKKDISQPDLKNMTCKNILPKNGESGQLIYWKSKLLVTKLK